MTVRTDLPDRRPQALFDFSLDPYATGPLAVRFTGALGWPDRTSMRRGDDPLEVFVSCNKSTDIEALARDVGILVSLLRQHGCGFDTMRAAVARLEDPTRPSPDGERGAPASFVGRLLDEIETFTREEAVALAGKGL